MIGLLLGHHFLLVMNDCQHRLLDVFVARLYLLLIAFLHLHDSFVIHEEHLRRSDERRRFGDVEVALKPFPVLLPFLQEALLPLLGLVLRERIRLFIVEISTFRLSVRAVYGCGWFPSLEDAAGLACEVVRVLGPEDDELEQTEDEQQKNQRIRACELADAWSAQCAVPSILFTGQRLCPRQVRVKRSPHFVETRVKPHHSDSAFNQAPAFQLATCEKTWPQAVSCVNRQRARVLSLVKKMPHFVFQINASPVTRLTCSIKTQNFE
mmetsp:Transcript_14783/g.25016  ORF Transcript_14783/g.25016 Transcript_14783/m.25016 type:complete len:266 (+) Transcript_14783:108-905(+)